MPQILVNARRQIAQVSSHLKQGNLVPAAQGLRNGLAAMQQQQLLKGERDEFVQMVSDAVMLLANNRLLRQVFPLRLQYKPGEEAALIDTLDTLLETLQAQALEEAKQMLQALEARQQAQLGSVQQQLSAGEHDAARSSAAALAKEFPEDAFLHAEIGELFARAGLLDDGISYLTSATELDPTSAYANNHLAIALRKKGHFESAEKFFFQAQKLAPEDQNIHFNLGRLYVDWGRWPEAQKAGEAALAVEPDFAEARKLVDYARKKQTT